MADYFVVDGGTGDGSLVDPWGLDSIDWSSCVNNTLYFLDTFNLSTQINLGGGTLDNIAVRGDYASRPATIDGGGNVQYLMKTNNARTGFDIQGFTFRHTLSGSTNAYLSFTNTSNITIKNCIFDGSEGETAQGVRIYAPPTGNIVADVIIEGNIFQDLSPHTPLEGTDRGNCIIIEYFVNDGNYVTDVDIKQNTADNCNQFYKGPLLSTGQTIADFPRGLRIDGNEITNCERAMQQIHWQPGGTDNYIRYNKLMNLGTPGDSGVGNHKMNCIQLSACAGGAIYSNYIEGWEKEDYLGDGCGIILDWMNQDSTQYCDQVDVFDNEIKNSGFTLNYPVAPGIELWRAKDCEVYNNTIINCRTGISISGVTDYPENSSGNNIHDNIIDKCHASWKIYADAGTNTIEDNTETREGEHSAVQEYVIGRGWEDHYIPTEDQIFCSDINSISSSQELSAECTESIEIYSIWVRTNTVGTQIKIGVYSAEMVDAELAQPVALLGAEHLFSITEGATETYKYYLPTPVRLPAGRYITVINADTSRAIKTYTEGPGYHRARDNSETQTHPDLPITWVQNNSIQADPVFGMRARSAGAILHTPRTDTVTPTGAKVYITANVDTGTTYWAVFDEPSAKTPAEIITPTGAAASGNAPAQLTEDEFTATGLDTEANRYYVWYAHTDSTVAVSGVAFGASASAGLSLSLTLWI